MSAATGEFLGRRADDVGGSSSDDDDDAGGGAAQFTDPRLNLRKMPIQNRTDEEARLNLFVGAIAELAEKDGGLSSANEDAIEDHKRHEFIRYYKQAQKKQGTAAAAAAAQAKAATLTDLQTVTARLHERVITLDGRVRWTSGTSDDTTVARAGDKVARIEATLAQPVPPTDATDRLFWAIAERPPWTPLASGAPTKSGGIGLDLFAHAVEEHFAMRVSALVFVHAQPHRTALLFEWTSDHVSRGLAFILTGINAEARALCAPDAGVISYQSVAAELRGKSQWRYVGATVVPLLLIQSARAGVASAAKKSKKKD